VTSFPGTVVLVSHDRDFLDRTVTSIIASEGDGRWLEYAGGYSNMLAQRRDRDVKPEKTRRTTAPDTRIAAASVPARAREKCRLSYKQKYALETLPAEMEKIAQDIGRLETELAGPALIYRKCLPLSYPDKAA